MFTQKKNYIEFNGVYSRKDVCKKSGTSGAIDDWARLQIHWNEV